MFVSFQRKILVAIIGLSIVFNFLIGCGEEGSQPVARVGGRIITVTEFEDGFSRGKSEAILAKSTLQEKLDHLNKIIDKELQIVSAYRNNLDKDEEIIDKVEKRGETTVLRRLIEIEIIDPNIPESEIRKFYNKSQKQVQMLKIFLKISPNPTDQEQRVIEEKLQAIKTEIKRGADFSALVKKYSQEQTRTRPGESKKEILKWSPTNAEQPIHQKAFSMKVGEVSEPIKTKQGYSIIKIIDITKPEVKPYSKEKMRIKQELLRMRGKELEKKYFEYLDKLKKKYNAEYYEENIQKFIQVVNDTSEKAKPQSSMEIKDVFDRFSNEEKELALVKYEEGEITIGRFIEDLRRFPITRRPNIRNREEVFNLLDRRVLPEKLLKLEADAKNIKNDKEVKKQFKSYQESFMLSKIKEIEINDKISITEDSLKNYFEEHLEEFKNPEKREVQEILVKDENLANQITARARAGEDFTKLARKYNEKTSTKSKDGNLGFITKTRYNIGRPAFETEIGGIAGPIKVGKNYSIIKVLRKKEAELKTFEESKQYLKTKLNREFRNKREKEWMVELREQIEVTIYENRLENTFSNLAETN